MLENNEGTIQRNWHHRVQDEEKTKTMQYVLDTTKDKQTQIT